MKSTVTFLVILFLGALNVSAQSLKLMDLNGNDVTNAVFSDVYDTSSIDPYEFDLDVINLSASNINVECSRTLNSILPQSESYFCWDVCYSPVVSAAFTPLTINANDTLSGYFHAYFTPNFQAGTSTMRYLFRNDANPNDTANITIIIYTGTLGVQNGIASKNNSIGSVYPNPAKEFTSIKYAVEDFNASTIVISNELGQVIEEQKLTKNKGAIRLNTGAYQPGIYFYSLFVDGLKLSTKKFIVTQ